MKIMIGYTVWSKRDMLAYLIEGITAAAKMPPDVRLAPEDTQVAFSFDTNVDQSFDAFNSMREFLLERKGYKAQAHCSDTEIRELGGHHVLMQAFMNSDADILAVFQDDQRIVHFPTRGLAEACAQYGDRLGLIGGRDGYYPGYAGMLSSTWSESVQPGQARLKLNCFMERPRMNSGPVFYNKRLIEKVGWLDLNFRAYYAWDDYGQRAINAGFSNLVIGNDLVHAKFGMVKATQWESSSGADFARLVAKHSVG